MQHCGTFGARRALLRKNQEGFAEIRKIISHFGGENPKLL